MQKWMSTEQAAEYLGISSTNVYSLAQQGRIPSSRLGKVWRFSKEDLDGWVRTNKPIQEFFISMETSIQENPYLRDPQKEGYAATQEFFAAGKSKAILQLPVGCGKT